jgi:hypothetical protein
VSTLRPHGPTLCSTTRPHKSRLPGTSRLGVHMNLAPRHFATRESLVPLVFHSHSAMAHTALQLSGYHYLTTSRFPWPNYWTFSCNVPKHDTSRRSNGPPVVRIQRLSFPRYSRPRDLEYPMFGLSPCELLSLRDLTISRHLSSSDERLRFSRHLVARVLATSRL